MRPADRKALTEAEFKTIPPYVKPENRQRILALAVPNEKEISDVDCNEYLIRHWLETEIGRAHV